MSDDKHNKPEFTNEDTIVRRAWIESALEGVRGRLNSIYPEFGAGLQETGPDEIPEQPAARPDAAAPQRRRPQLYVAWSSPTRRSGT